MLIEDLVSPNPIVDLGYSVILNKDGGWVEKDGVQVTSIKRDELKWSIDLKALQCLSASISDKKSLVMSLHQRMGHPSCKTMVAAIKAGTWINVGVSFQDVEDVMKETPCTICDLAKSNRSPISPSTTDPRTIEIGAVISGDVVGKISPLARDGSQYFYLFVDRRTSYYHCYTSANKDGFINALKDVVDFYKSRDHPIQAFRTDSEDLMKSSELDLFLKERGIESQYSFPYSHHQNLVERHVQTVKKLLSAVMHGQKLLDPSFWDYALFHLVSMWNSSPNTKTNGITPRAMIFGNEDHVDLNRSFLFPFGQPVAARIPKRTWAFDLKAELGVYLGESTGSVRGGLVFYPSTKAILARSDLVSLEVQEKEFSRYSNIRDQIKQNKPLSYQYTCPNELIIDDNVETNHDPQSSPPTDVGPPNKSETVHDLKGPMTRRRLKKFLRTLGLKVKGKNKGTMKSFKAMMIKTKQDDLSSCLNGPNRDEWIKALKSEIDSLLSVTKSLVPEEPDPNIPFDIIWATTVLKRKLKADGSIDKFKVRIPVCGNQLKDYQYPTYSPTVSPLTHMAMLQLTVYDELFSATFDTIGAYLHQAYPSHYKPIFVKLPRKLAEVCGLDPNTLYRVKKYLYGLPDAGRAYYEAYSHTLKTMGYRESIADPCLFIKLQDDVRTYIWCHVDDTFLSTNDTREIDLFHKLITQTFPVTIDHDISSHLGITITKQDDGSVKLTQGKLLTEIFEEYDSIKSMDTNEKDSGPYLRLLGQLMYMVHSRPDIATAVSYAATKSIDPSVEDWKALLKIVTYLKQTPELGLTLHKKKEEDDELHMVAFVDAAYMSHEDAGSHTGYCIGLGRMPESYFYSKSIKQKLVATSSTHAEIRALYEATIQILFLLTLFEDVGRTVQLPVTVYEDNQSAIDLIKDGKIHKSKHFLMLIQFLREQQSNGKLSVIKCSSEENISNVLTKIISSKEYVDSFTQIMGIKEL